MTLLLDFYITTSNTLTSAFDQVDDLLYHFAHHCDSSDYMEQGEYCQSNKNRNPTWQNIIP